jgi:prepilin-type N-terminal cleavage/methylation domain-containing protein
MPAKLPRNSRGFTLLEVMIAMALLLIGGVSVLSVFTLAVSHRVQRDVESKLDLVRSEALAIAQESVDRSKPTEPPAPILNHATSQPAFTVSARFTKSPNKDDPSWVAVISVNYRGQPLPQRQGDLKPAFLNRNVYSDSR